MPYKVKNYDSDKFPRLVEFYESVRAGRARLNDREVRFLRTKLERPHYDPEKNLFIIEGEDRIIALLDIVFEPRIDRIVLNCLVQPGLSFMNLSRSLMEPGMARCLELKAGRIHVCLRESDNLGHDFFLAEGYSRVRTYLELKAI